MKFFSITKPGIIFGNMITLCGGYFLAPKSSFNLWLLISILIAMALVIACGCVLNNIIDRDIDGVMERTKDRVMVKGEMSVLVALTYAIALGIFGFLLLYYQTNALTLGVAFLGLVFYVGIYSLWFKRNSIFGTAVGGVSGAVPPVVGYCAVTNTFDWGAISLFLILFFWQLPHFYAISMFRSKDYSAADIPVLPNITNIKTTKIYMVSFVILFLLSVIMPYCFGYGGLVYLIIGVLMSLYWLYVTVAGFKAEDDRKWARKVFGVSILTITILSFAMLG